MVLRRIVYGVLNMVACIAPNCALRAPTVFGTNKKRIRTEKRFLIRTRTDRGFIQDRRLRADVLFIRPQSAIPADGPPAAPGRSPQVAGFSQDWLC